MIDDIKKKKRVRQHYIPQFYLKQFSQKLYCYDKKNESKFSSDPSNLAVKTDFYGGEYQGLDSLETIFSKIENIHSLAMKKLIEEKNYYALSPDDKLSICEFFSLQYLRTESQRLEIKQLYEEMINLVAKDIIPKNLKVGLSEFGEIQNHLNIIKDYQNFAKIFFNMKFITYENHTPIPFWTSDDPITKQNEYDIHAMGNLGITNSGIEIHLPISPTLSIWAVDPILFREMPNTYHTYKKQHIIRENFLQLKNSLRFVYSNTNRFHLIKSMLKDNPHFKEGNRKMEIMIGESDKGTILMTSERNDRWPVGKEVMGKMETWIEPEIVEKFLGRK